MGSGRVIRGANAGWVPVHWYHGTFYLEGRRVRIPVARGCDPLWVRLARDIPYPVDQVRSITLVADAGRLHLDDTRQRNKHLSRKAPKRGQRGSRRWRKLRARQRKHEAKHRRGVRQAHHQAAKRVVAWAVDRGIGTLVVGDPKGITTWMRARRTTCGCVSGAARI